jgi:excisionase family DNA binding protein
MPSTQPVGNNEHIADELISIQAAAHLQHVSHMTIRRRIADGSLPGYRLGPRLVRVKRSDVVALLRPIPTAGSVA